MHEAGYRPQPAEDLSFCSPADDFSSDRMQRNKATVATKKTCKCRRFHEADGIRTYDLLPGKQDVWFRSRTHIPWKAAGSRAGGRFGICPVFPATSREFGHPTGTQRAASRQVHQDRHERAAVRRPGLDSVGCGFLVVSGAGGTRASPSPAMYGRQSSQLGRYVEQAGHRGPANR